MELAVIVVSVVFSAVVIAALLLGSLSRGFTEGCRWTLGLVAGWFRS
jgi:hypothetical protein